MKRLIYCVRDRAAEVFGTPFLVTGEGAAIRDFKNAVNSPSKESPIYNNPEDFELYSLGSFNDNNGMYETGTPRMVCTGKDHKIEDTTQLKMEL